MSDNKNLYPRENEEKEVLLCEAGTKESVPISPKKKGCKKFRWVIRLFLSVLALFGFFTFLFAKRTHYPFKYKRQEVNSAECPRHRPCNPTIPFKIEESFSFDPKVYQSFGVGIIGHSKFNSVKFVRHDSSNITFDSEIYISSINAADQVKVGSHIHEDSYNFAIKGPDYFHGKGECFKAHVKVGLPKDLESLHKIWVHIPLGDINTDFGSKLVLEKLDLKLVHGDLKVHDQVANQINLASVSGNISAEKTTGETVALYTTHGHVVASNVKASYVFGATVDGDVDLLVHRGKRVHAKTVNGNNKVKVDEITSDKESGQHGSSYEAASVNGNNAIILPSSYKGRFASKTFNGKSEVVSKNKDVEFHFTKQRRNVVIGYIGNDAHSPIFAKSSTFNGNTIIEFV